jgi:hypothetical protein
MTENALAWSSLSLYWCAVSDDFRWATLIVELEREFAKRNMRDHLALLARFKDGYDRQSRRLAGMPRPPWTTEMLVELAAIFQLAPFHEFYPVVPRDNRCPHCRADLSSREVQTIRAVLADRQLHGCKHCGGRWLVLKAEPLRGH